MIFFIRKFFNNFYDGVKKLLVDPACKYDVQLCEKICYNHDVRIFKFAFPEKNMILGHGNGNHCLLHSKIGEEYVTRPYSPTSIASTKGYAQFIIKVYFKNNNPKFPDGGKFSQHLDELQIGDIIQISGPGGRVTYSGKGNFIITPKDTPQKLKINNLGLIAGGVGFTPALAILRSIAADPKDKTKCSFIYASKQKQDILLIEELEAIKEKLCGRLEIWYTLEKPEAGWPFGKGVINKQMLLEHLHPPCKGNLNLISGPWVMVQEVQKLMAELGYTNEMYRSYI